MSEDPGFVEELGAEPRPPWLGTPTRRVVAALCAAVLLALVSVRLIAALPHTHHVALPTPVSTPRPSVATIGPSPVDVTPGRPNFRKDDPAYCPDPSNCTSRKTLPAGVLLAIRAYLPHARSGTFTNVEQLHPHQLYFREARADAGDVTVLVVVSQSIRMQGARPTEGTDRAPAESTGYVRTLTDDGYVVQVQFTGLRGYAPPMAQIRALAADARLLTLG